MPNVRTLYRENAVRGASRVGLVVLLYEQIIEDLRCAAQAMEARQIEVRTRYINHAILILGHLQSTLDMEQGGKVAQNLEHLYKVLRAQLVQAHAHASKEILQTLIENLLSLRDAWIQVDRAESTPKPAGDVAVSSPEGSTGRKWQT
ncbi:MAG TPA: flagellar export chaperone FliS [Terriglobales bacterium]|nr:flagellar export chaperone FliS [Terriglobales bacterium]